MTVMFSQHVIFLSSLTHHLELIKRLLSCDYNLHDKLATIYTVDKLATILNSNHRLCASARNILICNEIFAQDEASREFDVAINIEKAWERECMDWHTDTPLSLCNADVQPVSSMY